MSTCFETYLQYIGQRITIRDEDRQTYTKDFDIIRDYVLDVMCCEDRVFKWIYKGPSLFGSYSNNVRINSPDEFDVIFKLSVPFSSRILVEKDEDRPGFVCLDFSQVKSCLNSPGYEDVYDRLYDLIDWDNNYLRRSNLQRWLYRLITNGLKINGKYIRGYNNDVYKLEYSKRGLAHTIFAHCPKRKISIDFIPAIVFGPADWMAVRSFRPFKSKCYQWFAIPKPVDCGPRVTRIYSFMICNPKAEHDLLLRKQNLKVVFRLLKSIRNEYEMDRFKSYFLTTAFLWKIQEEKRSYWNNPLSIILLDILDDLHNYFHNGNLPFFWDPKLNLLDILFVGEVEEYTENLRSVFNKLNSYLTQPKLTYGRCASHFEIPSVRQQTKEAYPTII